jgi:HK97 family phage portal protein
VLGLGKLFRTESKSFNLADWSSLIDFGAQTASEILVSPLRAEECQTFNTGKRIRCETLGTLSLKLYRREGDASVEASDHPLYRLLHDRPNPWTSAAQFIMMLESDTIMYGNGFAFANRVEGKIVELIRLNPLCVVVLYDVVTLEPSYRVSLQDGSQKVYQWQDILHVPSPNGLAAVKTAREAIGLAIALERHAAKILGNGARPSGVLKAKGKLNDTVFTVDAVLPVVSAKLKRCAS